VIKVNCRCGVSVKMDTDAARRALRAIADARGYVSIHRLVASEARGRWVTRGEGVRPIDGDPWNWAPSNLQVVRQGAGLPLARRFSPTTKFSPTAKPPSRRRAPHGRSSK
jgi:hypothetical protein